MRKLMLAGALLVAVVTVSGPSAVAAPAEPSGTLTFEPESGYDDSALTALSDGTCSDSRGNNLQLRVTGPGFAPDTNVTPNLSVSVYSVDPTRHGYDVPLQDTLRDFAAEQQPAAVLTGRYEFSLVCKGSRGTDTFGTFRGSLTFTTPRHYQAETVGVPGEVPAPSAVPAASVHTTSARPTVAATRPTAKVSPPGHASSRARALPSPGRPPAGKAGGSVAAGKSASPATAKSPLAPRPSHASTPTRTPTRTPTVSPVVAAPVGTATKGVPTRAGPAAMVTASPPASDPIAAGTARTSQSVGTGPWTIVLLTCAGISGAAALFVMRRRSLKSRAPR